MILGIAATVLTAILGWLVSLLQPEDSAAPTTPAEPAVSASLGVCPTTR